MELVAHNVITKEDAEKAIKYGCDYLEIDVAQRIIFSKFTVEHHGIKGKLGIGPNIDNFLNSKYKNKLFLDIKHARYSLKYVQKFSRLLRDTKTQNRIICGSDWKEISQICDLSNNIPYYTLKNSNDWYKFTKIKNVVLPKGFSIKITLVNKILISKIRKKYPKTQVFVWTINNKEELEKFKKLKVDGIITDSWKTFIA